MKAWSYSSLKDYETCARKYHAVRVLKRYPREETVATLYGTNLHEQAEMFVKDGKPLSEGFSFMQPALNAIMAMEGTKLTEHEMGLKQDLSPCKFDDPACWTRGIADLIVLSKDGTKARCFDWKSGSDKYPDVDQLLLMALLIFQHFPTVQSVTGGLLFVLKGTVTKHRVKREQAESLWWRWRERVARLDASHTNGKWLPKRSGLCRRHCPVDTCEFWGI